MSPATVDDLGNDDRASLPPEIETVSPKTTVSEDFLSLATALYLIALATLTPKVPTAIPYVVPIVGNCLVRLTFCNFGE